MSRAQFAVATEDFAYGASAHDLAGLKLSLSIFADRGHIRSQLREDAEAAGLRVAGAAGLAEWRDDEARALGDVVLLDCPQVDGAVLAALARLDMRCARAGAALIVSTSVDALDDVFACLDRSKPQILVNPSRAERLIALGQVLVRLPGARVRELSEDDRLMLLRLTEQVNQIAKRMERFDEANQQALQRPAISHAHGGDVSAPAVGTESAFRFTPSPGLAEPAGDGTDSLIRTGRPPLPDPQTVRRIIRQRQQRARFFDGELFADPAWDMLLDLTAARAEHSRVSVTSLCIASGVPPTTALRWIGQMTDAGLLQRNEDETDRRRAFITLTEKAVDAMSRFFAHIGASAKVI